MSSRYGLRETRENNHPLYKRMIKDRGDKKIIHFRAPKFAVLSDELIGSVDVEMVYWGIQTRYWKLATEYYGDPSLWWVIAYFNRKPTESHVKIGEMIFIPVQWEIIYNAIIEGDERFK